MQGPPETPATVAQAEGVLLAEFRTIQDQSGERLRAAAAEIDRLIGIANDLRRDYARLEKFNAEGVAWLRDELAERDRQLAEARREAEELRSERAAPVATPPRGTLSIADRPWAGGLVRLLRSIRLPRGLRR